LNWRINTLQSDLIHNFHQHYKHISTNSQDYEIFCWLRWFYLLAYMEGENIAHAFYLDSDVLIFSSPAYILSLYPEMSKGCAFSIPQQEYSSNYWCAGGQVSYWTQDALRKFCCFTIDSFQKKELLDLYIHKWSWHLNHKIAGGICDMTTLYLFSQDCSNHLTNFLAENRDGIFDMNFNSSDNFLENEYEMERSHKKVVLSQNRLLAFSKDSSVNLHTIHFQGWAKRFIPYYYRGLPFQETLNHKLEKIIYSVQNPLKIIFKPYLIQVQIILKKLMSFYATVCK